MGLNQPDFPIEFVTFVWKVIIHPSNQSSDVSEISPFVNRKYIGNYMSFAVTIAFSSILDNQTYYIFPPPPQIMYRRPNKVIHTLAYSTSLEQA